MTPFQPAQLAQPTSTTCVDTSASDVANRASVDGWKLNPLAIRRETRDTSGGITYTQAADAVKSLTMGQIVLAPRFGLTIDQVRDLSVSGRGFAISIDCSITIHTSRHTGSFTGGHTVYVQRYRKTVTGGCGCELKLSAPHGEFLIEDPGTFTAGYLWWSESLVNRAAQARTGNRGINVLVGQDTEGVYRTCQTTTATIRAKPSTSSTSKGKLPLGAKPRVVATINGEPWDRDTGGTGTGWHHIRWQKSATVIIDGFVRGEALR